MGEDFWPQTFDPSVVDRWVRVSDRDSFLTTRRLAETEGILAGGSGGTAVHAALEVAATITDPEALIVVVLPDGGRSYLSKIFNDGWMTEHGYLERTSAATLGEVLRRKHGQAEIPPMVSVHAHQHVRDAVALLHEHGVSQMPVVSAADPTSVVGSVTERGLLAHAVADAALLDAEIVRVMEAPLPAVATTDPVRDAVELLMNGERSALLVLDAGRAVGIVSRGDLLEALAS